MFFNDINFRALELIGTMAAMSLHTTMLIEKLETKSQRAKNVVQAMTEQVRVKDSDEMIGQSKDIHVPRSSIHIVAPSYFAILIDGKTKMCEGLVACSLYQLLNRSATSMVYVNCAAIHVTGLQITPNQFNQMRYK